MKKVAMTVLSISCFLAFPGFGFSQASSGSTGPSARQQHPLKVETADRFQVIQQVSVLGTDEMVGRIDWENRLV
jgi:hypothetical protein